MPATLITMMKSKTTYTTMTFSSLGHHASLVAAAITSSASYAHTQQQTRTGFLCSLRLVPATTMVMEQSKTAYNNMQPMLGRHSASHTVAAITKNTLWKLAASSDDRRRDPRATRCSARTATAPSSTR